MIHKYRYLCQFCGVKIFCINQNKNLLLSDDPGRVRSQIKSVVYQIQRFDFDCNLVVTRKVIIRIPPPLRLKPLIELLFFWLIAAQIRITGGYVGTIVRTRDRRTKRSYANWFFFGKLAVNQN